MVKHEKFETVILIAIIVSSLKLVVDTYMNPNDPSLKETMLVSSYIDVFFTFFFCFEMIFKAVAFGFILDSNSYLHESWS